jgi:hypothetical protein
MFSPDGRQVAFASTRGSRFGKVPRAPREFNVFLVE